MDGTASSGPTSDTPDTTFTLPQKSPQLWRTIPVIPQTMADVEEAQSPLPKVSLFTAGSIAANTPTVLKIPTSTTTVATKIKLKSLKESLTLLRRRYDAERTRKIGVPSKILTQILLVATESLLQRHDMIASQPKKTVVRTP